MIIDIFFIVIICILAACCLLLSCSTSILYYVPSFRRYGSTTIAQRTTTSSAQPVKFKHVPTTAATAEGTTNSIMTKATPVTANDNIDATCTGSPSLSANDGVPEWMHSNTSSNLNLSGSHRGVSNNRGVGSGGGIITELHQL